jgi:hypothetical protein
VTPGHGLGVVHGGVGVAQEVLGPLVARLVGRDPDAGGEEDLAPRKLEGRVQGLLDALRHPLGDLVVRHVVHQHRELVPAQAGHGVARSQAGLQPAGDLHQQLVPGQVAEAVVDALEAVDVQEEGGEAVLRPAPEAGQAGGQPVHEQGPVGQAGQRVVEGAVPQPLLGAAAVGDVGADGGRAQHLALGVAQHGVAPGDEAPVAGLGEDLGLGVGLDLAADDVLPEGPPRGLPSLLGHEAREPVVPDHLVLHAAQQLQQVIVAVRDGALQVEEDGHELHVVQDLPQAALRLAQRVVGELALGDVEGGGHGRGPALDLHRCEREVDPPRLAAPGQKLQLEARRGRARPLREQAGVAEPRPSVGMGQVPELHGQQLGGLAPGQGLQGRVDVAQAFALEDEHRSRLALRQCAEARLAVAQRGLRGLALADVAGDQHGAGVQAVLLEGRDRQAHVHARAVGRAQRRLLEPRGPAAQRLP